MKRVIYHFVKSVDKVVATSPEAKRSASTESNKSSPLRLGPHFQVNLVRQSFPRALVNRLCSLRGQLDQR